MKEQENSMADYDNPNGASLVMDIPRQGPGPFWMSNHPMIQLRENR